MPNVSIYFREPDEKEKFESEALALGAKAIRYSLEYLNDPRAINLQCTQKQLKGVFSLREGHTIEYETRLAEAKCKHVVEQFKGTVMEKKLSYGSYYCTPWVIQLRVTTYEDYCLVMNAIKDVKENYLVEGKAVKKQ
jgi:hypothetical protein